MWPDHYVTCSQINTLKVVSVIHRLPHIFFSPNFSTFLFLVFLLELLVIYLFRTANLKHIFSILSLSIHQNVYFIVIPEEEAGLQEHLMAQ